MSVYKEVSYTPSYVVDEGLLIHNLEILKQVQQTTGCKIILALKGFAMYSTFPTIKQYLFGVTASSLHEARLGFEEFGREVHVYSPAYRQDEFPELLKYTDHIVFNSFSQWELYKENILNNSKNIRVGLRINPEHSEVKVALYDPSAKGSRLGIKINDFKNKSLEGITGLHFHNLCELNSDALERTLNVVEEKFGNLINQMKWMNFGGGHHITRPDYDIDKLCKLIIDFKNKYNVEIYIEPGEAIALHTGFLVSTVLDIVCNDVDIAILDTSAAAHMPDVLEMPYRPEIIGAGKKGEYPYLYRLAGSTCLSGDVIGDYTFPTQLKVGGRIVFKDMAHYTMVKNNTFNGINLPAIMLYNPSYKKFRVVKKFGYEDYKNRLS